MSVEGWREREGERERGIERRRSEIWAGDYHATKAHTDTDTQTQRHRDTPTYQ